MYAVGVWEIYYNIICYPGSVKFVILGTLYKLHIFPHLHGGRYRSEVFKNLIRQSIHAPW